MDIDQEDFDESVEQMYDDVSGQVHTQHTTLPVPFLYAGTKNINLKDGGSLADVAPTMLDLLNVAQPQEMTGKSLIQYN